jgi:excisionase family DNA binding protein
LHRIAADRAPMNSTESSRSIAERWNVMNNHIESCASKPARLTPKPLWVSPREAIFLTGIKRTRLYELLKDGTLKSIKIGRKRLISYASLEALGASQGADR